MNKQVELKWDYFSKQLDIWDLRLEDSMSDNEKRKEVPSSDWIFERERE